MQARRRAAVEKPLERFPLPSPRPRVPSPLFCEWIPSHQAVRLISLRCDYRAQAQKTSAFQAASLGNVQSESNDNDTTAQEAEPRREHPTGSFGKTREDLFKFIV